MENEQRTKSLLTVLVQQQVKERLRQIHLALKAAIDTLLLKCDSDITSVIASIKYSEDGTEFDIKLCWTPEFDEFISTGVTTCDLIYRTQDASQFINFLYKVMRSRYTFKIAGTQLRFKRILTGHFFKPHLDKFEALKQYALDNKDNTNPACRALCKEINILSYFSIKPGHRSDGAYKRSEQSFDNGCTYFEAPKLCMMCHRKKNNKQCRYLLCKSCCLAKQRIDKNCKCYQHTSKPR